MTSSQFLIDSESNLRAAISQLLGDRGGNAGAPEKHEEMTMPMKAGAARQAERASRAIEEEQSGDALRIERC